MYVCSLEYEKYIYLQVDLPSIINVWIWKVINSGLFYLLQLLPLWHDLSKLISNGMNTYAANINQNAHFYLVKRSNEDLELNFCESMMSFFTFFPIWFFMLAISSIPMYLKTRTSPFRKGTIPCSLLPLYSFSK